MKKIILSVSILLLTISTFSQENSVFDKFEFNNEVTTVVVTKQAFLLLKKVTAETKEAQEYKKLVSGLNDLKVFTTQNANVAVDMRTTFDTYIKSKKMNELMRVKDKEANVKIYTRPGKDADHISEFLMLVDSMNLMGTNAENKMQKPEMVIVTLTGNINLNDIAKITSEMNIPGNEHIKDK